MNLLYELWLHDACGFDPSRVGKCIFYFENAYNAFHSKPYSMERMKAFASSGFLSAKKDFSNAERIIHECKAKDIRIVTIDDEDYPSLLREIYIPPRILFVKGSLTNFDEYFPLAGVGTRIATEQGKIFAKKLSGNLVENNKVVVISGMADGIDTQFHKGALENGGKTIAVLAGGVDIIYPISNKKLYYEILKNGAIVSEQPPGIKGKPHFYRQRNRIIAGLAKGVIVSEGKFISGTRHTVNAAHDNNRDVFAIPSNPMSIQSQYPNKLLKEGATVVTCAEDIIEQYISVYPEYFNINRIVSQNGKITLPDNLSDEEKRIIEFLIKKGGRASVDEISACLDIPTGPLTGTLMVLAIKKIVYQESQNNFILKEVECFAN